MNFVHPDELELEAAFTQLGMADYVYLETMEYVEHLEQYRNDLIKRIKEIQNGNNKNMDDAGQLRTDSEG